MLREPKNAKRGLGKSFAFVHHLGKIDKVACLACEVYVVGVARCFLHHLGRACSPLDSPGDRVRGLSKMARRSNAVLVAVSGVQ